MPDYNLTAELEGLAVLQGQHDRLVAETKQANERRQAAHAAHAEAVKESRTQMQADRKQQLAFIKQSPELADVELPKLVLPELPDPPAPLEEPAPPPDPVVYTTREVTLPEEIETAWGSVTVAPPMLVMSGPSGDHAISPNDLERFYTPAKKSR